MATTDLGKWMITNGGDYDASATYDQLTMVMYDNSTYITLRTVTGITPIDDKVNYRLMAKGFDATALSSVTAVDTSGILGAPNEQVSSQALIDAIADRVANKLVTNDALIAQLASYVTNDALIAQLASCVTKSMMSGVQVNDSNKVPTSALVNSMNNAITTLNTNKAPTYHASESDIYGRGNWMYYGHVKLSDEYAAPIGGSLEAIGASQHALYNAYNYLNNNKQTKIHYTVREAKSAEQAITNDVILDSNEPNIPFDCYVIANYHLTLYSSSARARVYWMLGGAYFQGNEVWDGTSSAEHAFDKTFVFEATKGQNIQLRMSDANNVGVVSKGNNGSLNRFTFIFIPKQSM